MGKLNKDQLQTRRKQVRLDEQRALAKTEIMQFRVDEECINRIYAIAEREQMAVSAMLRKWVIERLIKEENNTKPSGIVYTEHDLVTTNLVREAFVEEHNYLAAIKLLNENILSELKALRKQQK